LRKYPFVVLVLIVLVALQGSAAASPQFASTFQMTYTSPAPSTSSGLSVLATWADPGEPFGKPIVLTKIVFNFNPGTKFDTSALPICKATDLQVRALGTKACPANTLVAHGDTNAIPTTGIPFTTVVSMFNAKRQIIVVIYLNGKKLTFFRDDVQGSTITSNLDIPAGISLTRLHIEFPRHSTKERRSRRGKARKRKHYMATPSVCPPSGLWTTNVSFSYADGSTQALSSNTPCK
jgi:hypothetical protein